MRCSWCQKTVTRNLSIKEILWPTIIMNQYCKSCHNRLTQIPKDSCPTCRKSGVMEKCEECMQWQRRFPTYDFMHHAFFVYDSAFQEWLFQYKFLGDYRLRSTFTTELKSYFKQERHSLICPVPLSQDRFLERGFNQTQALLDAAGIPTVQLLEKAIHTAPQAQKNRIERLAVPQPFVPTNRVHLIKGKKIILFDDVYTTGRTLFHAADVLRQYQPAMIRTISLAR